MAPTIRPLERTDLEAVAALLGERLPGFSPTERFLADTLLDHPWSDPDLPSLVALDGSGELLGCIGIQARRVRLAEREIRAACCSHLAVVADRRAGLTGTVLLRNALAGPQELSWTDAASADVLRLWRALGGRLDHARTCDWMLALKPGRWLAALAGAAAARDADRARALIPVRAIPAQTAGARLLKRAFPDLPAEVSDEQASVQAIVDYETSLERGIGLRTAYDAPYLEYAFGCIARVQRGTLVHRLVRLGGEPIGWYAYLLVPGGAGQVLAVAASETNAVPVLGKLIESARAGGSTVLTGRAEPHLQAALRRHQAVLGYARHPLTLARDPEIEQLLASSSSLLTLLDGEWFVL